MPPSYNVIDLEADEVRITMREPGRGGVGEEALARFAREAVTTSQFYPGLERFVRYASPPNWHPTVTRTATRSAQRT